MSRPVPVGPADGPELAHQRLSSRARELIRSFPPPAVPLESEWHAGLGHLVRSVPRFPERLTRLLSPLDRVAEVRLTPEVVGFNGEDVRWRDITEVRLGSVTDLLSASVFTGELDRIVSKLPPVPGRKWIARRVTEVMTGLTIAVVESVLARQRASAGKGGVADEACTVPVSIAYRSRLGRRRELVPGLFGALLCSMVPDVTAAILDTAARNGVETSTPSVSDGSRWALQIQKAVKTLEVAIARTSTARDEPEIDEA